MGALCGGVIGAFSPRQETRRSAALQIAPRVIQVERMEQIRRR
jgi:hypothetical protein